MATGVTSFKRHQPDSNSGLKNSREFSDKGVEPYGRRWRYYMPLLYCHSQSGKLDRKVKGVMAH